MSLDSISYVAGPGPLGMGLTLPIHSPAKDSRKDEFVSWGPGLLMPKLIFSLSEAERAGYLAGVVLDSWTKDAMLTDAVVKASVGSLTLGVLDGGIKLTATHPMPALTAKAAKGKPLPADEADAEPDAAKAKPPAPAPAKPGSLPQAKPPDPDQINSQKALDWCQRTHDRLGEGLTAELYSMLYGSMGIGVKLAEITCEVPTEGPDAGKLLISKFKVRANRAWRFMVDAWLNVRAILTWNPNSACFELIDTSKFVWMSWMPRDSDPRGESLLTAAHTAWNLKVQLWPIGYSHAVKFGSPGIDIEMAENDLEERQPIDPETGEEIEDADPISSTAYVIQAASLYKAGGTMVHPFGSKVGVFESKGDGSAIRELIEVCNREIATAIEFQAKVMLEAQHSSKAEGGVGQDTKSLVIAYGRQLAAAVVRKMHRQNLEDNFGKDFADRFTPLVSFGGGEKADLPAMLAAASSAGYAFGPSQMPELDAMLGVPVRDPEEDAQHAEAAMTLQQKFEPKDDTGTADKGKPPKSKGD